MAHPTTEERVAAEEERLGRRLPERLRARLIEENGGEIETDDRYAADAEDNVWELGPVADTVRGKKGRSWPGAGLADHTEDARETYGEFWEAPAGSVVIADNGTADLLLLLPDDRVLCRLHEDGELLPVGLRLRVGEGRFLERL